MVVVKIESKKKVIHKPVGKHIYGQLYGVDPKLASNKEFLENLVKEAVKVSNSTLLELKSWKIGEGVSVIAVILESHIAIHTWPEFEFVTVDVYTCGEKTNPEAAFEHIVNALKPKKVIVSYADRSY